MKIHFITFTIFGLTSSQEADTSAKNFDAEHDALEHQKFLFELCMAVQEKCVRDTVEHSCDEFPHLKSIICQCKRDVWRNISPDTVCSLNELPDYDDENMRQSSNHCPPGGCQTFFDIDSIWQYGCWCNFGDHLMTGHGIPRNPFDEVCKKLQLCLRCVKFDAKHGGFSCDPHTDEWAGLGFPDFHVDCTAANPNDTCGEYLCSCNTQFLADLLEFLWQPAIQYEDTYLHSNGFNNEECEAPDTTRTGEMDCCGYYPRRFPYGKSSSKQCCENKKIYNFYTHECCDDGDTVRFGDMCS